MVVNITHACDLDRHGRSALLGDHERRLGTWLDWSIRSITQPRLPGGLRLQGRALLSSRGRRLPARPPSPHTGRGPAGPGYNRFRPAWMYRLLIETLLGLNREGNRLRPHAAVSQRAGLPAKFINRFRRNAFIISTCPGRPIIRLISVQANSRWE